MSKKSGGRRSAITKGPEKLAEAGTAAAIEKTRPKYRVLVKTAIKSLGGKADHKQIMAYAKQQNFKNLNARTLRAHLNFMTVNTPSRVDYPSHRKARGYNPDYDVLYSTGCRVSELCEISLSDLDLADYYIKLKGKGSKQRIVPIGTELKHNLIQYLEIRDNFIQSKGETLFLTKSKNKLDRTAVFRIIKN